MKCSICGTPAPKGSRGCPKGWIVTSSCGPRGLDGKLIDAYVCGVDCARKGRVLSEEGIAHLWPQHATEEGERALRANEDRIARGHRAWNPKMVGMVLGSMFKHREERYDVAGWDTRKVQTWKR